MAGKHRKRGKKSERKLRSLSESLKTDSKSNFVNEKARRRNPKDSEVLNAEATRIPEVGQDSKYQFVSSGCNPRDQRNVVLHDHVPNKKVEEIITRQISYRTVYNRNDSRSANGDSISHLIQEVDYLKNQVNRLTQENLHLYNALQNAQSRIPPDDSNDVAVIIRNKCLEEKYLPVLTEFVEAVINGRISVEDVYRFCNSHKNIDQEVRDSRNTPEGDLFSLDISAISEPNTSSFVPRYETSFGEILQDGQQNDKDSDNRCETRVSKSCFNCSESHHLNECPYKIDVRRVINARKQAKAHWVPSVRYHVHGKKETGFKPGVLSEELMEALRLQKNEVPMFIYRMRVLDYPPGWLQEAAVESSGITLYGLDGNVEKDENCEDGVNTSLKVQYDPDKLIDFPGFNVPLPPDVADEAHLFGLPPIQEHHLRCVQEQYMSKPDVVPCRKRKLQFSSSGGPSKIQRFEEDMEVEGDLDGGILEDDGDSSARFIPPLPKDPLPPPPPEDPLFLPPPSPAYEVLSPNQELCQRLNL